MENENQKTIEATLAPPKVPFLAGKDFVGDKFIAEVAEIKTEPHAQFKGETDYQLVLRTQTGTVRRFSLWGDNYRIVYENTLGAGKRLVGATLHLGVRQTEKNGKVVTERFVEKVE